jgi:hypothetical protein
VLEDGLAMKRTNAVRRKGQAVGVTDQVHVWEWREVEISKAGMDSSRTAPDRERRSGGFAHRTQRRAGSPASGRLDLSNPGRERPGPVVLAGECLFVGHVTLAN